MGNKLLFLVISPIHEASIPRGDLTTLHEDKKTVHLCKCKAIESSTRPVPVSGLVPPARSETITVHLPMPITSSSKISSSNGMTGKWGTLALWTYRQQPRTNGGNLLGGGGGVRGGQVEPPGEQQILSLLPYLPKHCHKLLVDYTTVASPHLYWQHGGGPAGTDEGWGSVGQQEHSSHSSPIFGGVWQPADHSSKRCQYSLCDRNVSNAYNIPGNRCQYITVKCQDIFRTRVDQLLRSPFLNTFSLDRLFPQ